MHPFLETLFGKTTDTETSGTINGLQKGLANRLRKDQADSTPFPLGVASAVNMSDAVRKAELVGGILRPYRLFKNVGATPVGASVRTGQSAEITDALNLGMVYKITNVRITTVVAPALSSTITIKTSTGTTVFTRTVALVSIPAVGSVVDVLGFTGTLPTDVTLPATLLCTASAGTFEIFCDGVLV